MAEMITERPLVSRRKAAIVQMILGYIGIIIAIVQGLVLVPMYLHYVDGRLYGLWLATGGVVAWLGMLDLGVAAVMGQRIAQAFGRQNNTLIREYYYGGTLLQAILTILLMLIGVGISLFIPSWVGATRNEAQTLKLPIILAAAALGCTLITMGQKNTADALQRPFVPLVLINLGALIGLAATVILLRAGEGVRALAGGMLIGGVFAAITSICYVRTVIRRMAGPLTINFQIVREIGGLTPSLFAAKAGAALIGRIEPTIISSALSPEMALSYSLTRRAADIAQTLMDRVVGAITAGVAHLYAQQGHRRAGEILRKITGGVFGIGITTLCCYIVCNRSFIELWIGAKQYGGNALTISIALSTLSLAFNNMLGVFLNAVGDIATPCWLQLGETLVRLVLMVILLENVGVIALPITSAITSAGLILVFQGRIRRLISPDALSIPTIAVVVAIIAIGASTILSHTQLASSWTQFVLMLALVAIVCGGGMALSMPDILMHRIYRLVDRLRMYAKRR